MVGPEIQRLSSIESDKPRDKCTVVGVYSKSADVPKTIFDGLVALNHRGQESSGIVISNGAEFKYEKDSGLAAIVFGLKHPLPTLTGSFVGAGHDRYSTSGSLTEMQPFLEDGIAIAHNGNLTNAEHLRKKFNISSDIEGNCGDTRIALAVINKMIGTEQERILKGLKEFEGAYSFVFITKEALFASRDPLGFRPLSLGKIKGDGYVIASETSAFPSMKAEFVRDIRPGETVRIDDYGVTTVSLEERSRIARCIFELLYLARIDFGISVADVRMRLGKTLASHIPDVDWVSPVPRSGIGAAEGVAMVSAQARGIPYREALYSNPYKHVVSPPRTFILPDNREEAAADKYDPIESVVRGKRIALVDDTIVRGTTIRAIVSKMRAVGALEVHALIPSPPLKHGSFYGVDFGGKELVANKIPDLEERRKYFGLDSLYHMNNVEVLEAVLGNPVETNDSSIFEENDFCAACFTGRYPTPIDGAIPKTNNEQA